METLYLDIETVGLDPRAEGTEIRVVSIDGTIYDLWKPAEYDEALSILWDNTESLLVAHNAQFELDWLTSRLGWEHTGKVFDTMVAHQILTNGVKQEESNLGHVVYSRLGIELNKREQNSNWARRPLSKSQRIYARNDSAILRPLHEHLSRLLKRQGLARIMDMEMAILPILVEAKQRGVLVDTDRARRVMTDLEGEVNYIEYKELPDAFEMDFNPRSPTQVRDEFLLFDASEDTLKEEFRKTGNRRIKAVMDIKKRLKKISSIQGQILDKVGLDGRIHTTFHQTFTDTGRFSSRDPNLQNQDSSSDVRGIFIASPGHKLVIADYSQLELRIAAYLSRDEAMINAYKSGRDLHSETQLRIFGDPSTMDKDTAKRTRTLSKNINFGLIYGGGHGTLVKFAAKRDIILPEEEAREYKAAFMEAYPQLAKWQRRQGNTNRESVKTPFGRRCFIEVGRDYCKRINHPVQGGAGDGMKWAMLLMRQRGVLPLLTVHDEIVVEAREEEAEDVARIMKETMLEGMYAALGMDQDNPVVPLDVEVDIGDSWADKS